MRFRRTFIFVDLSGFTTFTEQHGDGTAAQLLSKFRAVARAVGSHQGVRIDKYLGDGLMAVAVEAHDGITFAMELQRHATVACAPLSLRIGIATGDTMLFEGQDYIGSAPNMAARLCDAAAGVGGRREGRTGAVAAVRVGRVVDGNGDVRGVHVGDVTEGAGWLP